MVNWKIRFTDGSEAIVAGETITEAMQSAEFQHGKQVRSARFIIDNDTRPMPTDKVWGYGWGEITA